MPETQSRGGGMTLSDNSPGNVAAAAGAGTSSSGSRSDHVHTIGNGVITNAMVSATAAVDFSKLAALASGNILVGNGSNVAASVAMSGDVTISNAGVAAISAGVIGDADVSTSAAIAQTKIAAPVIASGYGDTLAVGDASTYADVTFTEDVDTDTAYNGTTFTVPTGKGGYYEIFIHASRVNSLSTLYLTVKINAADDTTHQIHGQSTSDMNELALTYHRIVNLSAGDTVVVRAHAGLAAQTFDGIFVIRRL